MYNFDDDFRKFLQEDRLPYPKPVIPEPKPEPEPESELKPDKKRNSR